jgi:hypothetical protein
MLSEVALSIRSHEVDLETPRRETHGKVQHDPFDAAAV